MGRLFGTDGVRGIANRELTAELALALGRSAARTLAGNGRGPIYVGRDTRVSGQMLEAALVAGITSAGVDAVLLGVVPTPGVAYLTRTEHATAGAVISASHNPMEDNGIKFFYGDGYKLPDETEDAIEAGMQTQTPCPVGAAVGRVYRDEDAWQRYGSYLVGLGVPLAGLRVVVDCANGAASQVAPWVYRQLGADCRTIHAAPDGENINLQCGSTHPESLQRAVVAAQADLGLAHDGDADRLIAVDENGNIVDGDHMLAIFGLEMLRAGKLTKKTLAATLYSNLGLQVALRAGGGQVLTTKAGDRYVLEAMQENGLVLGGEQSGHLIFLEHSTTGDGILTAIQLMTVMRRTGCRLSELAAQMSKLPQVLINVRVQEKDWESNNAVQDVIATCRAELGENGRIFVRASGTEPLIRVLAEGTDFRQVEYVAQQVAAVLQRELG